MQYSLLKDIDHAPDIFLAYQQAYGQSMPELHACMKQPCGSIFNGPIRELLCMDAYLGQQVTIHSSTDAYGSTTWDSTMNTHGK